MSLTRFLPVPSDRMGILWSLLSVNDAVILEYGPAGTNHFSMGLFGDLGIEQENRLFTTHMREDDVVMGDTKRLEQALIEIDRNLSPEVIFVIASSCSAVIGTDIRGICTMLASQVKARLIAVERGGFREDYSFGIKEIYSQIVTNLVTQPYERIPGTYNIIGSSSGSYRAKADMLEIVRLMNDAFGMSLNACLCMDTDIDSIRRMSGTDLNLVLRTEGLDAAKYLSDNFNTPYVFGTPYGYSGTYEWLESIAYVIKKDFAGTVRDELKKRITKLSMRQLYGRLPRDNRAEAYIYGEAETVRGLSRFMTEAGIEPVNQICIHNTSVLNDDCKKPVYLPEEKERIDILKKLKNTFVLADDISKYIIDGSNTYLRISNPVIYGTVVADHMPVAGIRGADMIMESAEEYLDKLQ